MLIHTRCQSKRNRRHDFGDGIANFNHRAFRWTQAGGMVDLGTLQNNQFGSWANAVSGDGTIVVGGSNFIPGNQAFRWQAGVGMVGLGDLAGGSFLSEAFGVSPDGAVIVGSSMSTEGSEAFRWTQVSGMVGLGDLGDDFFSSEARGASNDGSLIVGFGSIGGSRRAFIWDAVHGMRNLRDVLDADYGLGTSVAGWTLFEANAISPDGKSITGTGINPAGMTEAWVVSLTAGSAPSADFDGDDDVDGGDFLVWQQGLGVGTTSAQGDANGDSGRPRNLEGTIWRLRSHDIGCRARAGKRNRRGRGGNHRLASRFSKGISVHLAPVDGAVQFRVGGNVLEDEIDHLIYQSRVRVSFPAPSPQVFRGRGVGVRGPAPQERAACRTISRAISRRIHKRELQRREKNTVEANAAVIVRILRRETVAGESSLFGKLKTGNYVVYGS